MLTGTVLHEYEGNPLTNQWDVEGDDVVVTAAVNQRVSLRVKPHCMVFQTLTK